MRNIKKKKTRVLNYYAATQFISLALHVVTTSAVHAVTIRGNQNLRANGSAEATLSHIGMPY